MQNLTPCILAKAETESCIICENSRRWEIKIRTGMTYDSYLHFDYHDSPNHTSRWACKDDQQKWTMRFVLRTTNSQMLDRSQAKSKYSSWGWRQRTNDRERQRPSSFSFVAWQCKIFVFRRRTLWWIHLLSKKRWLEWSLVDLVLLKNK